MKVLQIAGSGAVGTANAGPISTVITHLCRELASAGHRVLLVDALAREPRGALAGGIDIVEALPDGGSRRLQKLPGPGPLAAGVRSLPAIRRAMRSFTPDIVHVHDAALAVLIGRGAGIPVVWTGHGLNWTMESSQRRWGPRACSVRRLETAACAAADHTVVLNRQTHAALARPNVSVIPNGIDLSAWPTIDRAFAREQLGWSDGEFRVTFVGRIAPEKGVDVLARALDEVPPDMPLVAQAVGSLAGHFGTSTVVTRYAQWLRDGNHRIEFLGFLHRDTPEYRWRLAASDLVVVPSITEPFGLVVLEALACGARVVGSDVGGIRDILQGGLGRLVPGGDVHALAQAITDEYERPVTRDPGTARDTLAQYEWANVGRSYASLLQQLSEGGS